MLLSRKSNGQFSVSHWMAIPRRAVGWTVIGFWAIFIMAKTQQKFICHLHRNPREVRSLPHVMIKAFMAIPLVALPSPRSLLTSAAYESRKKHHKGTHLCHKSLWPQKQHTSVLLTWHLWELIIWPIQCYKGCKMKVSHLSASFQLQLYTVKENHWFWWILVVTTATL